jgi:hypothetical protein
VPFSLAFSSHRFGRLASSSPETALVIAITTNSLYEAETSYRLFALNDQNGLL